MREFHTLKCVRHPVPVISNMADDLDTSHPFAEPIQDGVGLFCTHGDHHAHAHVERSVHFTRFHATGLLEPIELREDRKWGVNIPPQTGVKTKQV